MTWLAWLSSISASIRRSLVLFCVPVPHFTPCVVVQEWHVRGARVRPRRRLWPGRVLTALLSLGIAGPALPAVSEAATAASSGTTAKSSTTKKKTVRRASTKRYSSSASRARRARLARARASARLHAFREALTPQFTTDASGAVIPDVRAAAAIVLNPETGEILFEENAKDKRSIASITKVMTAVVYLEDDPDLAQPVQIERADVRAASTTYLKAGGAGEGRRSAAPHAHRIRQRRGARARRASPTAAPRASSSG